MSWTPIGGTLPPLDEACYHGVMWTRERGNQVEMIHLPGRVVARLGGIPAPEIAWLILKQMDEALA